MMIINLLSTKHLHGHHLRHRQINTDKKLKK